MAANGSIQVAEGHVGNLTSEQEALLRKLWQTVFLLYTMFEHTGPIVSDAGSKAESTKQRKS
jgi:hypothetical protein